MTRVTSRSEPLFQSVRVRLRFASTHIIRFSSGSLFAILKNTVWVRLRFDKNSVQPVCILRFEFGSTPCFQHFAVSRQFNLFCLFPFPTRTYILYTSDSQSFLSCGPLDYDTWPFDCNLKSSSMEITIYLFLRS